jgi:hypothetical protein
MLSVNVGLPGPLLEARYVPVGRMRRAELPAAGKHNPFPRTGVPVTGGVNASPSGHSLRLALNIIYGSIFYIMAETAVGSEYCSTYLPVSFALLSLMSLFNLDPHYSLIDVAVHSHYSP